MAVNTAHVRSLIAEAIDVDEDVISGDAHFINDIGVDSLSSLEVLVRLEKEFGMKIPESDLPKLVSLNLILSYLEERVAA